MDGARVRRAGVGDAGDVARLLHRFNSEYSMPTPGEAALTDRLGGLLATGQAIALVGGPGPDGVAVLRLRASLWSEPLDAYLEELYVVPEHRGRGLGRALLEAVLAVARDEGAGRIELGTSEDDIAAIALYERLGFTDREGGADGPRMRVYERDL